MQFLNLPLENFFEGKVLTDEEFIQDFIYIHWKFYSSMCV